MSFHSVDLTVSCCLSFLDRLSNKYILSSKQTPSPHLPLPLSILFLLRFLCLTLILILQQLVCPLLLLSIGQPCIFSWRATNCSSENRSSGNRRQLKLHNKNNIDDKKIHLHHAKTSPVLLQFT